MTYALNVKRNLAIASLVAAVLVAVLACVAPSAQAYAVVGAYAPVSAQVPAQVIVKGDVPAQAQDFTVQISGADGETVLPDQLQATIAGKGSTQFAMSFTEVGLHHYTVRQVPGNAEGWTYDERVYNVDVYCMWSGQDGPDSLYTQVSVEERGGREVRSMHVREQLQGSHVSCAAAGGIHGADGRYGGSSSDADWAGGPGGGCCRGGRLSQALSRVARDRSTVSLINE